MVQNMLRMIRHRGPDGYGVYMGAGVGLGNARLSIIDIAGGDQPISNESHTLWIVYNGEIFNYIELRPDLEKHGHRFSTNSDTEVILHLYEELGPNCLDFLNGQFVFAIWDEQQRSLFVARDRVGVRPFFYTVQDGRLVFGSEIKSILTVPGINAEIDPESLKETFTYWSPLPPHTIFKRIYELPPAHFMQVRNGQITIQPYWHLDYTKDSPRRSTGEYLEEFEHLLIDAARIRLRADVSVGAYLSGGLDSSTTTAMIRAYNTNRLDTFSITFSDEKFDESYFQEIMAHHLETDHHVVHCTHQDIGDIFPDVIWHCEAPIVRTAPAPLYLLSDLVRRNHFKVVLTGEGADEMLAGYDIFKEMKVRRFWAKRPDSGKRPLLFKALYPDIKDLNSTGSFLAAFFKRDLLNTDSPYYSHLIRWNNTARILRFLDPSLRPSAGAGIIPNLKLPDNFSTWSALSQAQYLEIITFLSPYLLSSQGDRMAMSHSVEGRYPFLDVRVIEFCNRLPDDLKMPVLNEKWLLKQIGKKYVPRPIWQRVKRPYRAPIHASFFGKQPPKYLPDLLSPDNLKQAGYFTPETISMITRKANSGGQVTEVEDMALVGVISTMLLHQMFIRNRKTPEHLPAERFRIIDRKQVDIN